MASGPSTSRQIDGDTTESVSIFLGSKITADSDCSHEIKRHFLLGRKAMANLDSILKSRDITSPTKVCLVKAIYIYIFSPRSHIWMWELDHKESWAMMKNWSFWAVLLEKTLEGPLDYKEIQPVNPKGNQTQIFIGRTDTDWSSKSSVQFRCSVMSDSLQPHRWQHTRLPCPSPTPGACSNSSPSSWWCHPTISSSVIPFFSCLQSFPASGSFPMSQFFASGGQSIGVSASASVLPMNI